MNAQQTLLKTASLNSLYLGVTCVLAGGSAAAIHGNLEILPLTLCLFFGIFAQLSINFCHRYNDHLYGFGENITDGLELESEASDSVRILLKNAMNGCLLLTGMLGLIILCMGGWIMLAFAAALILVTVVGNMGRHPLLRTPFGVLGKALAYGPIGTIAVCFLQSQRESVNDFNWYDLGPAVYLGLVCGFFAANWYLIHCYANYYRDKEIKKKTLTVVIGLNATLVLIMINALMAFGILLAFGLEYDSIFWWFELLLGIMVLIVFISSIYFVRGTTREFMLQVCTFCGISMVLIMLSLFLVICLTGNPFDTALLYF